MKHKDSFFHHLLPVLSMRYFIVLSFVMVYNFGIGQLSLDFNNGDLNHVKWLGDINNFKINTAGQLQLAASGAGESKIFTKYKVPADSIQFEAFFKMQFSPSNDNYGKIYLFIDKPQEVGANGYYLKLGENGNNDAIQLYKLVNGVSSLLGAGTNGAIALEPAQSRFRIKLYRNGAGMMSTDYTGLQNLETDLDFYDPALVLPDSMYFGIYCKYTATRSDKFFYDDIYIKTVERDTIPPRVTTATALNTRDVKIVFSERPEINSILNTLNYHVDNGLRNPLVVIYDIKNPLEATLRFAEGTIKSNIVYTLTIDGVKDISNNSRAHQIQFFFIDRPDFGDLIINEVLTDPYTGGEDFVEIYNKSDKLIKMDSLFIVNKDRNESKLIRTNFVLKPKSYVAVTKNVDFLKKTYQTPDTASFIEATIPALNVASANITLQYMKLGKLIVLDSFNYTQNMHFKLLNNSKGISLERIRFDGLTNDPNNWHSASADSHYATPGYKNSNAVPELSLENPDFMELGNKTFTPDGDGVDDIVLIHFTLEKSGYLATVRIFDSEGFSVVNLANNLLLSPESTIKWDGLDAQGALVKTGMYIVYARVFHPDGSVKTSKKVVVAAQKR
jgi:hypothetical protein